MTVDEAIRTFHAVRQFADRPLPDDLVEAILNAGRRSQSSKNTQPWEFVAVRKRETLQRLATTGTFAGHLAGAALGVVLVGHDEVPYDLGQVTAYMQLDAWSRGIGSCIAYIYEPDQARAILNIPADTYVRYALSFGYPAEEPTRRPGLARQGRRPLAEVVHWDQW